MINEGGTTPRRCSSPHPLITLGREKKVFALVTSSDLKKTQKSSHFAAHCVLLLLNGERCWSCELKLVSF